jgi:hypothetical protein
VAFSFLSVVANRVGLGGQFGTAGVAWGDFERFASPDCWKKLGAGESKP